MITDFESSRVVLTTLQDRRPCLLWSEGVQLLFVLCGTVNTLLSGESFSLREAGLPEAQRPTGGGRAGSVCCL